MLLGIKAIDRILKSRDISLPTKVCIVKTMIFPVVMKMWALEHKESWVPNDAFELWCWRRLLRAPWEARSPSQLILKEIHSEYSLKASWKWSSETLATWYEKPTHWKRPWCWERLRAREVGNRCWDDWMPSSTRWTRIWANFGRSEGQESHVCCSPWGHRVEHDLANEKQQSVDI